MQENLELSFNEISNCCVMNIEQSCYLPRRQDRSLSNFAESHILTVCAVKGIHLRLCVDVFLVGGQYRTIYRYIKKILINSPDQLIGAQTGQMY